VYRSQTAKDHRDLCWDVIEICVQHASLCMHACTDLLCVAGCSCGAVDAWMRSRVADMTGCCCNLAYSCKDEYSC
jgi:hypothetical protein